nr:MAG TPA: hypothetical protein [Caudoviricetes sp.]
MSHSRRKVKGKSFELFGKNRCEGRGIWYHDSR